MIPHSLDIDRASAKVVRVDLDGPIHDVPTDGAGYLYVVAFTIGRPVGSCIIPAPIDPYPAQLLVEAVEQFGLAMHHHRLRAGLEPRRERRVPTASVVVATCDRPQDLERCLAAIGRMQHQPLEVIVVDNGSRRDETEALVRAAGATYVVEPDGGATRARNRGASLASGEVVCFVDDDVEVDRSWMTRIVECFGDPLVMGVGGLVLPGRLSRPAHWLSEMAASHGRGMERRVLEGSLVAPTSAMTIAVGASIAFRGTFLRHVGGAPEELGPGTATQCGEETWTVHQLLSRGFRYVYEPAAVSYHYHRNEVDVLRRTVRGYGVGVGAYLLRTAHADRDPSAINGFRHWIRYMARKGARSVLRRPGAPPLRLVAAEALGMASAPVAYIASRRKVTRPPVFDRPLPTIDPPWLHGVDKSSLEPSQDLPAVSVVIPTHGRRDRVLTLLRALEQQEYPQHRLEIVVSVDGDVDGTAAAVRSHRSRSATRVVVGEHGGAGVARNRGAAAASHDLLVFFDDDVEPAHTRVLLEHAFAHADGRHAVVGPCVVDLRQATDIVRQRLRNWWVAHIERLRYTEALDFTDLSTGNFSIRKEAFEALGGFVAMQPREDWEFGYRLLAAGVPLVAAPRAAVIQVVDSDLTGLLENTHREGINDVAFARRHRAAFVRLPLAEWMQRGGKLLHHSRPAFARPSLTTLRLRLSAFVLRLHAVTGLRARFNRRLDAMRELSYWSGVAAAVGNEQAWIEFARACERDVDGEALPIRLGTDDWAPPPVGGPAEAVVSDNGTVVGRVPLCLGGVPWDRSAFASKAANRLARRSLRLDIST